MPETAQTTKSIVFSIRPYTENGCWLLVYCLLLDCPDGCRPASPELTLGTVTAHQRLPQSHAGVHACWHWIICQFGYNWIIWRKSCILSHAVSFMLSISGPCGVRRKCEKVMPSNSTRMSKLLSMLPPLVYPILGCSHSGEGQHSWDWLLLSLCVLTIPGPWEPNVIEVRGVHSNMTAT